MVSDEKHYGVFHTWEYDFDENLELISITRTYFNSYEDMVAYEKKFAEEHPDIVERRRKGEEKMFKEMFKNVDKISVSDLAKSRIEFERKYCKTWICDPDKCPNCGKDVCQSLCFRTTKKEQRATGLKRFKYWLASLKEEKDG